MSTQRAFVIQFQPRTAATPERFEGRVEHVGSGAASALRLARGSARVRLSPAGAPGSRCTEEHAGVTGVASAGTPEPLKESIAMSGNVAEMPIPDAQWKVPSDLETVFDWDYTDARRELAGLYEKGKAQQWNANARIDWSQDLDPENPQELPDEIGLDLRLRRLERAHAAREGATCAATSRPGSSRSSCTASRVRWSARRRSSSRCPTSTRSTTRRRR